TVATKWKTVNKSKCGLREFCCIVWSILFSKFQRKLYLPEDGCQNITPTSKGRASTAISLGLHSYYAFPLLELPDQRCLGVFEIVSTKPSLRLPNLIKMKEQLPGFIVASGNELGQRMIVEVVKVTPSDELDSFEIGQPLSSVQPSTQI
uniref:Uncharacterized protein n=1 Tax=Solanum lycopersicum TaxID=4081 RepID=A0A3Q7IXG3_SOLLC